MQSSQAQRLLGAAAAELRQPNLSAADRERLARDLEALERGFDKRGRTA